MPRLLKLRRKHHKRGRRGHSRRMGNNISLDDWGRSYELLREVHDEAYKTIEDAIRLEEQERPNDAVEKYKQGILVIDKALEVVITCPENPEPTWEQACKMVQKMKKTRAEVLMRINSIMSSPAFVNIDPPPSYEDAMSSSSSSRSQTPLTYGDLAQALDNLHINTPQGTAEIIYSQGGVKLYFILPNGTVTSSNEGEVLNVAVLEGSESSAFLQIGAWVYPLVPGVSPCYKTDYGAFIFPDVHSDISGSSVGLILPEDADTTFLELLENILHGVVNQETSAEDILSRHRREMPDPGVSGKIARGLLTGAFYLSKGLIYGAQKTGELINYGTPKIINNLTPTTNAQAPPPKVTKALKMAKTATTKAVDVSGFLVEKVGVATSKLGHFLAPHLQRQGTRILQSGFNMSEKDASDKVEGVLTVAASAVEGFATVYQGLESSASILGQNLKQSSVKIVEHKYGNQYGEAANDALSTAGNVYNIRNNTRFFTPKGLAKQTGKTIVRDIGKVPRNSASIDEKEEYNEKSSMGEPSTSGVEKPNLYPDLDSLTDKKSLEKK